MQLSAGQAVLCWSLPGHQQRGWIGSAGRAERHFNDIGLYRKDRIPHRLRDAVRLLHQQRPTVPVRLPPRLLPPRVHQAGRCVHGVEQDQRRRKRGNTRPVAGGIGLEITMVP